MNDTHHIRGPLALARAALFLLALAGCSGEDENRAGRGLLPPYAENETALSDTVLVGTLEETDYQLDSHLTPSDASGRLPVVEEAGMRSRALVRFGTLPVAGTTLLRAQVKLTASFVSNPPPRLRAYELLQGFPTGFDGEDPFPVFDAAQVGEDTTAAFVFAGAAVESLVQRWIEVKHVNAGLVFALAPGDTGRVELRSRDARIEDPDVRPLIELYVTDGSATDTLLILPSEDTFLSERVSGSLAGQAGRLTIARGVAARSLLRFEMSPAIEARVVHQAFLTLAVDTAATQVRAAAAYGDTTLVTAELVTEHPWDGKDTDAEGDVDGRALLRPDSTTLRIEITDLVRRWVQGETANQGLRLRFVNEGFGLDWARFYATSEAESLRPRLEVLYSLPPGALRPVSGAAP